MLHHLSFAVVDLVRSAAFYDETLAPLGYVRVWADSTAVGYGLPGGGDKFAIKLSAGEVVAPGSGFHLAFAAPSRESVDRFYAAALQYGGRDNGAPELCREYGEHYYAAFVIDPDGYRIEAVINTPVHAASGQERPAEILPTSSPGHAATARLDTLVIVERAGRVAMEIREVLKENEKAFVIFERSDGSECRVEIDASKLRPAPCDPVDLQYRGAAILAPPQEVGL